MSYNDRNIAIFDLGSVLICGDFDTALLQDPRIPNEYIEDLKKAWLINDPKFTETCTKDQYIKEAMNRASNEIKYYIPVVAEISTSYLNILPHTYSLINELRKDGYSLYYLSNWNKWSAEELIRFGKMDFLNLFDGGIFSYEVGCMKPDEKIYKILLDKYDIDPNKAIFFDDKKENIETANRLGIEGILFDRETGDEILKDFILNESYLEESKAKDHMPKECKKCHSKNIGTFFAGEPIYKCKDCGEYLGTVPFPNESTNIFTRGDFDEYKEYGASRIDEMTSKERNELEDDDFGIPSIRKYPLHDKKHVEQAIKMFNHVEKKYEAELADNVLDAMERYHISTDSIGEKNKLKKYVEECSITEGLIWNDNTPEDIKKLKESIKEEINLSPDIKRIIDSIKDSLKNRDFTSDEKSAIIKVLKKVHFNIDGYTIKTANYGSVEISNTHQFIGTFKDYILTIKFIGSLGNVALSDITINYSKEKCDIPKNVAFDFISMLSPHVDNVRTTKRSIKISALSNAIDSGYPRVDHKYGNKYAVKKGVGGLYITLSTMKSLRESDSVVAAALPRQNYQPDAVYVVNYLKKNTFENCFAVCKDKMSNIFINDNNQIKHVSLSEFKEIATDIKVYRYNNEISFNEAIESIKYQNAWRDGDILEGNLNYTRVPSYIDELNSIEECIINSVPRYNMIHEVYCPNIPLVDLNTDESNVHFFRDINGVYAQNIDTLSRSASYKSVDMIPNTTISILRNM